MFVPLFDLSYKIVRVSKAIELNYLLKAVLLVSCADLILNIRYRPQINSIPSKLAMIN